MEFVGNIDPAKCIVLLGVFGCSKKITMSPLLGMLKEGNIPCWFFLWTASVAPSIVSIIVLWFITRHNHAAQELSSSDSPRRSWGTEPYWGTCIPECIVEQLDQWATSHFRSSSAILSIFRSAWKPARHRIYSLEYVKYHDSCTEQRSSSYFHQFNRRLSSCRRPSCSCRSAYLSCTEWHILCQRLHQYSAIHSNLSFKCNIRERYGWTEGWGQVERQHCRYHLWSAVNKHCDNCCASHTIATL